MILSVASDRVVASPFRTKGGIELWLNSFFVVLPIVEIKKIMNEPLVAPALVAPSCTFVDALQAAQREKRSVLCIGLDPQMYFMPPPLVREMRAVYGDTEEAIGELFYAFNRAIIDAVHPLVCMTKPQAAFYERSHHGWKALEKTGAYARYCELICVKDAKRFDGGDTADAYADAHIGTVPPFPFFNDERVIAPIRMDAMTIGGYIGEDCVGRFAKRVKEHGTGIFVVDKTSFKPNSDIEQLVTDNGLSVWERLAHYVKEWSKGTEGRNGYSNVGVVMGATYPEDAVKMRGILPMATFLVPGLGKQGGSADEAVVSVNDDGFGIVVSDSRAALSAWMTDGPFKCDPKYFAQATANYLESKNKELTTALRRTGKCAW